MISSLTPSEKNCISESLERLSKASTTRVGSLDSGSVTGLDGAFPTAAAIAGRLVRTYSTVFLTTRRIIVTNATSAAVPLSKVWWPLIHLAVSVKNSMRRHPNVASATGLKVVQHDARPWWPQPSRLHLCFGSQWPTPTFLSATSKAAARLVKTRKVLQQRDAQGVRQPTSRGGERRRA